MTEYLTGEEREQARPIGLSYATNDNSKVTLCYANTPELIFHFNDDWVEGVSPSGETVRLKLSELTRFDMDYVTREGDDKTHFYFYLLLESPAGRLVYYCREPEYVYNPIPGLTRKDIAELNLGALAHLANLDVIRSVFGRVEPWKAFRQEGETGPPRTPDQRARDEQTGAAAGLVAFGFMLFGLWFLWRRWPR